MGGLLIVIAIVVPTLLWADLSNRFVWIAVFSTCAFAAIGFADDYTKVTRRRNLGLTGRAKLGLQIATSIVIASMLIAMQTYGLYSTKLIVPFFKQFHPDLVVGSAGTLSASMAAGVFAFHCVRGPGDRGLEQRRESHRRPRRAGHRMHGHCRGRADGADLRQRPRDFRDLSGTAAHAASRAN